MTTTKITMKRLINKIVIHHSAVIQTDINKLLSSIQNSHKTRLKQPADKNGSNIAYHYIIGVDGEVKETRDLESVGRHASNLKINKESIGICLSGDFDKQEPTEKQYKSLLELVKRFDLDKIKIHYHKEYAKKTCPGTKFGYEYFKGLLENKMEHIKTILNKKDGEINGKNNTSKFLDVYKKEVTNGVYKHNIDSNNNVDGHNTLTENEIKRLIDIGLTRLENKIIQKLIHLLKNRK